MQIFLRLTVVLVACAGLAGAHGCAGNASGGASSRFEKVEVFGDQVKNGLFDASVEYGDDGVGWLAYSRVKVPEFVGTSLAKSTDGGKSWTHVADINESAMGTLNYKGKQREGAWRNETPSLLYDRTDSIDRRWKLFSQRYFTLPRYKPKDRVNDEGWIEYRTAATPAGPWSKPIRLFGKKASGSQIDLSELDDDLKGMSHYNEIGSIAVDGVIYLSLDASPTQSGLGEWEKRKVILVSSEDHGKNWLYNGTLTDYGDADAFGYRVFTGSSLVREGDRLYALLTPAGARKKKNKGHDGTYVVEFEDISKARLKRDKNGKLVVVNEFTIDLTSGGLADYDEKNTHGGLVMAQINVKARPDVFQTYSTRQRLVEK